MAGIVCHVPKDSGPVARRTSRNEYSIKNSLVNHRKSPDQSRDFRGHGHSRSREQRAIRPQDFGHCRCRLATREVSSKIDRTEAGHTNLRSRSTHDFAPQNSGQIAYRSTTNLNSSRNLKKTSWRHETYRVFRSRMFASGHTNESRRFLVLTDTPYTALAPAALSHKPCYRANSTTRFSRMTFTLISPGYLSSPWMRRAISRAILCIARSEILPGLTKMRSSRPAEMA